MLSILLHLYVLRIRSIIAFSFCFARYKRVVYLSLCKPKLSCTHCWISTEIYFRLVQLQFYHVPDYSRWKYSCDVNFPHERSRYSPLFLHSTAHAPFTKLVWLLLCNFIWWHSSSLQTLCSLPKLKNSSSNHRRFWPWKRKT